MTLKIFKEIHETSKDLNKELDEYNMLPYFTYIFFFFVFLFLYIKKYITKLLNNIYKHREEVK